MIYKIIMEFDNLEKIVNILLKDFHVLFFNNCLYVCSRKLKNVSKQQIKKILLSDNIFLQKIDETNLKHEVDYVKNWCESYFVLKDIKDFEDNEQKLLREYMNVLDDCEKQLQKKIEEGGG